MRWVEVVVVCFMVTASSVASAEVGAREEAVQHFRKGTAAYRAGDLDEAIVEFKTAIKILPSANGVYALAQAQRDKGDLPAALRSYRQYLEMAPKGDYAGECRTLIAKLEKSVEESRSAREQPPKNVPSSDLPRESSKAPVETTPVATPAARETAQVELVATKPPDAPRRRSRAWVWGVVVGGVVVVGLAVGLGVGLGASSNPTPTFGKATLVKQP